MSVTDTQVALAIPTAPLTFLVIEDYSDKIPPPPPPPPAQTDLVERKIIYVDIDKPLPARDSTVGGIDSQANTSSQRPGQLLADICSIKSSLLSPTERGDKRPLFEEQKERLNKSKALKTLGQCSKMTDPAEIKVRLASMVTAKGQKDFISSVFSKYSEDELREIQSVSLEGSSTASSSTKSVEWGDLMSNRPFVKDMLELELKNRKQNLGNQPVFQVSLNDLNKARSQLRTYKKTRTLKIDSKKFEVMRKQLKKVDEEEDKKRKELSRSTVEKSLRNYCLRQESVKSVSLSSCDAEWIKIAYLREIKNIQKNDRKAVRDELEKKFFENILKSFDREDWEVLKDIIDEKNVKKLNDKEGKIQQSWRQLVTIAPVIKKLVDEKLGIEKIPKKVAFTPTPQDPPTKQQLRRAQKQKKIQSDRDSQLIGLKIDEKLYLAQKKRGDGSVLQLTDPVIECIRQLSLQELICYVEFMSRQKCRTAFQQEKAIETLRLEMNGIQSQVASSSNGDYFLSEQIFNLTNEFSCYRIETESLDERIEKVTGEIKNRFEKLIIALSKKNVLDLFCYSVDDVAKVVQKYKEKLNNKQIIQFAAVLKNFCEQLHAFTWQETVQLANKSNIENSRDVNKIFKKESNRVVSAHQDGLEKNYLFVFKVLKIDQYSLFEEIEIDAFREAFDQLLAQNLSKVGQQIEKSLSKLNVDKLGDVSQFVRNINAEIVRDTPMISDVVTKASSSNSSGGLWGYLGY